MKRQWFADDDGGYYRNCPLILDEYRAAMRQWWRPWTAARLLDEWYQVITEGVTCKTELGWGDVAVRPGSSREAYPDRPGLWRLDQ